MKPTSEDFKPRRDGWFEHRGTWGEVVVGTVLADPGGSRTKRWEVTEVAHGLQVEYGHTLWMRIKDQDSGEEHTVAPRMKNSPVRILTRDPRDTQTGEPTPPSDAEAIMLLVKELGAEVLASRDNFTGEITCPDYASGANHLAPGAGQMTRGYLEHLRFAHGMDTSAIESLHWEERIRQVTIVHGQAHDPKHPDVGKGGFPHRHVPEDLSLFG